MYDVGIWLPQFVEPPRYMIQLRLVPSFDFISPTYDGFSRITQIVATKNRRQCILHICVSTCGQSNLQ
jgi:hypothetical protein